MEEKEFHMLHTTTSLLNILQDNLLFIQMVPWIIRIKVEVNSHLDIQETNLHFLHHQGTSLHFHLLEEVQGEATMQL